LATEDIVLDQLTPPLAARVHGPPDGRPVLALHGWLDNAASFDRLAPLLPEMRLVAVDLAGHGLSGHRSRDASYFFADWVRDIFQIAGVLGWSRFSLIGHSMGAGVASLAAAAIPSRIEALALIEGFAPLVAPEEQAPVRLAQYLAALARLEGKRPAVYATEREALAARMAAGQFASEEGILAVVRRGLERTDEGWCWRADPRLKLPSAQRFTPGQVVAFLQRIECPTLIVRALSGLLTGELSDLQGFAQHIRRLTTCELPGAHHLHLDDPAPVAAALREFFRSA